MADEAIFQRTLVMVAHPDDEILGCGILLQRIPKPTVVFCTDGAPRCLQYWAEYGSREQYGEVRRQEARSALALAGIEDPVFLSEGEDGQQFVDQDLFLGIPKALCRILELIDIHHPTALLTHAYEGGHPDHDACSFVGHAAGQERGIPVWEFPLYHCNEAGEFRRQQFLVDDENELRLTPTEQELDRKRRMILLHASQKDMLAQFDPAIECFRPMPSYDYSAPPHGSTLNYEAWGWATTGKQLCAAFTAYTHKRSLLDGLAPTPHSSTAA
jgi:LmbE family N-acetylglucosaminyl deacetylase